MSKKIKRISFAAKNYGLSWLQIDTGCWEIVGACGAGRHLVDRGMQIEYHYGSGYKRIEANIEKMG